MQGRLRESYLEMTVENNADCAPVGVAWKKVREDFPTINLYSSDGSHPSIYGSYLAACVFYSSMFHKTSVGNTYWSTLDSLTAFKLQEIASSTVLDSLSTWSIETVATTFSVNDTTIEFCDSVEVLNNWYSTNTSFSDTLNGVGSCAEITNYQINIEEETIDSIVNFCDSIELMGIWLYSDTNYVDTLMTTNCNSYVNYEIDKIEVEYIDTFIHSCYPIQVNGLIYNQDTMFSVRVYGNPCLIIYNYTLSINGGTDIRYFSETIYEKTNDPYGYSFFINVQNADSLFLYKDSVLIAKYPSVENNLTPTECFINCDKILEGPYFKTFLLIAKNECSLDSAVTMAGCSNWWGAINSIDNTHWQISPNPANNYIEIKTKSIEKFTVSLMDISGKNLINSQESKHQQTRLDVSAFDKGIYFLVIYDFKSIPIGQQRVIVY